MSSIIEFSALRESEKLAVVRLLEGKSLREMACILRASLVAVRTWRVRAQSLKISEAREIVTRASLEGRISLEALQSLFGIKRKKHGKGRPPVLTEEIKKVATALYTDPATRHLSYAQMYKRLQELIDQPLPSYHTLYRFWRSLPKTAEKRKRSRHKRGGGGEGFSSILLHRVYSPMMRSKTHIALKGLYVITDSRLGGGHLAGARSALQGGARIIQLRDKEATTRQLVEYAQALRALTREYHALLILNDRLDIALAVEADGVHLGQDDLPVPLARRLAGEEFIIGVTAETVDEAVRAEAEGADYLGVGPMFTTNTKPDAGTPIGPERLREIKQAVHIPVFGIGGITLSNAPAVISAGADGICVISAVLSAEDPEHATRQLIALCSGV